jgi:hypothetical protein
MTKRINLNGNKLFAILDLSGVVIDCWCAKDIEEAQTDNPGCTVIEVTLENSPFHLNKKYVQKEKIK